MALLLMLLPSLLAAVYYGIFAADQYVSEASFIVRDAADQAASPGLAQLAAQNRASNAAMVLRDYLLSRDAMQQIEGDLDLRRAWAGEARDPFTRFAPNGSEEALYGRYHERVSVVADSGGGVVTLKAQAFSPSDARAIARQLIGAAVSTAARLSDGGRLAVIVLVAPDVPDRPAEPRRGRSILTIFGFNLIFVAMAWLIGTGLSEYAAKDR